MRRSRLLGTLVVLVVLWLVVSLFGRGYSWLTAGPSLQNRVWVARIPTSQTDRVSYFLAVDRDGRQLGASGRASAWQQHAEIFTWKTDGDRLTLVFPQHRRRIGVQYRTMGCEGPGPLDQCLVLQAASGERVTLYSSDDLVLPDPDAAGLLLPTLPDTVPTVELAGLEEGSLEELL